MLTNTNPYAHKHVFYFWKLWSQSLMYSLGGEGAGKRGYWVNTKKLVRSNPKPDYEPVWPWMADIMSKRVCIIGDTCANTTPYAPEHVFPQRRVRALHMRAYIRFQYRMMWTRRTEHIFSSTSTVCIGMYIDAHQKDITLLHRNRAYKDLWGPFMGWRGWGPVGYWIFLITLWLTSVEINLQGTNRK